jgi:signal transduction histidine kinase
MVDTTMVLRPPDRRGILLACAGITLLFTLADVQALGHFSPPAFAVRIVWATFLAWAAFKVDKWEGLKQRVLFYGIAFWTSTFFGYLVVLTGRTASPLFHWILSMPVLVAVCIQELPSATAVSGVTAVASGVLLLVIDGAAGTVIVEWTLQAAGMSTLAWYATRSYQRLRRRELDALERARFLDDEIAARHRAEHEVRSRDDFLTVASHELRTPLTALTLQVQRLRVRPEGRLEQRLPLIEDQVLRLNSLVDSLFDVSAIRAEATTPVLAPVDLEKMVRDCVQRAQPLATETGSPLDVTVEANSVGQWDAAYLDRILTNLLANAIKYGLGKPIHVTVRRAEILVRDQGLGISAADQARIFERFERAVPARNYGGLGVGLWLARELVQRLGGELSVTSQPGQGSEFRVRLPLE